MAVLIFCIIRVSCTLYENQKVEVLSHNYRKGKLVSVKKGSTACFWIENVEDQSKIQKYIIDPYCSSRRLKDVTVKPLLKPTDKLVYQGEIYNLK